MNITLHCHVSVLAGRAGVCHATRRSLGASTVFGLSGDAGAQGHPDRVPESAGHAQFLAVSDATDAQTAHHAGLYADGDNKVECMTSLAKVSRQQVGAEVTGQHRT